LTSSLLDVRRGSQAPRISRQPSGNEESGREAVDLAALAGLALDDWQQLVLSGGMRQRGRRWSSSRLGCWVPRQNGKGPHDLRTAILTTDGWATIGDIRPGQYVYDADGSPVPVVACSEVFQDLDCYEVEFTDGSSHVVAGSHLWHVKDKNSGRWADLSTEHMATRYGARRSDNGRMEYRYRVRCDSQPDTPRADLPIDPYLLGYWLGDGTAKASCITVGAQDKDWVTDRIGLAGAQVIGVSQHDHGHAWAVRFRLDAKMRDGFESRCRRLGVWGRKHIPDVYLTGSIEQRSALLAGLMDSDGSIAITNRSPQVEFSASYPELAAGFHRLARSLGIRVAPIRRVTSHMDNWRFLWTPTFDPFEMPRKSERFKPPASGRQSLMSITSIERVESVPTRCIQVDRADGVYLVGHHFTPTHNSVIEARVLAGLFLLREPLIIWSAHQYNTAQEGFLRIRALIESTPDLHRQVRRYWTGTAWQGIELHTGQRLRFLARSRTSGRGFTGRCNILDEAQELTPQQVAAIFPTVSAQPDPQLWMFGTPPTDPTAWVYGLRSDGEAGRDRLAWFDWGADLAADDRDRWGDRDLWYETNPALGIRIAEETVEDEFGPSGLGDEFVHERLGAWRPRAQAGSGVIPSDLWEALAAPGAERPAQVAFALHVNPDRTRAAVAYAGRRPDGLMQVGLVDWRAGTSWVVDRLVELRKRWSPVAVAVDTRSEGLLLDLEKAGITVPKDPDEPEPGDLVIPTAADTAAAYAMFVDTARAEQLRHADDAPVNTALASARTRPLAGGATWDHRGPGEAGPLKAATLALWAFEARAHLLAVDYDPLANIF
jgi:hypothetical protein